MSRYEEELRHLQELRAKGEIGVEEFEARKKVIVGEEGNLAWTILGAILPPLGLLLYLYWRKKKPGNAKMSGIGAIIGVIVNAILLMAY